MFSLPSLKFLFHRLGVLIFDKHAFPASRLIASNFGVLQIYKGRHILRCFSLLVDSLLVEIVT